MFREVSYDYDPELSRVGYYSGDGAALPDVTPLIVGIIVLTGLALLFPTYVSLTSVKRRKKRDSSQEGKTTVLSYRRSEKPCQSLIT